MSKQLRKEDARRKILIGAARLAKVEQGEWPKEELLAMMNAIPTRPDDRAIFELAKLKKKEIKKLNINHLFSL